MSDKVQLIKEEIKRRISYLEELGDREYIEKYFEEQFRFIEIYESLIKFIDSLPEEPASKDLEEAMERSVSEEPILEFFATGQPTIGAYGEDSLRNQFEAGIEWHENQMKGLLQTEYEKGRFDMREEMMKDAVETTIVNDWQYGKDPDYAIIPAIHQRINGFNVGDKVKLIIIKDE